MNNDTFLPFTPKAIAQILSLQDDGDDFDPTGEYIAEDLLAGRIAFTATEIETIASFLGAASIVLKKPSNIANKWVLNANLQEGCSTESADLIDS